MVGKGTSSLFCRFLIRNKTFLASIRKMGEKKPSSCPSLPLKIETHASCTGNGLPMAGDTIPLIREWSRG